MAEYIEREAVLEILKRYSVGTWRGIPCYPDEIKSAAKDVNSIPAADVAPVVHGRWRFVRDSKIPIAECDQCYTVLSGPLAALWDYCPNCGARMEGEIL